MISGVKSSESNKADSSNPIFVWAGGLFSKLTSIAFWINSLQLSCEKTCSTSDLTSCNTITSKFIKGEGSIQLL